MINIVSDGSALGTKVYDENGEPIKGVISIEIMPIKANGIVTAKVELVAELDIVADRFKEPSLLTDNK